MGIETLTYGLKYCGQFIQESFCDIFWKTTAADSNCLDPWNEITLIIIAV